MWNKKPAKESNCLNKIPFHRHLSAIYVTGEVHNCDSRADMGVLPHALALPYPAQGHVIPLMELSHCLVDHGFRITFVNTEFNHDRVVAALQIDSTMEQINLVSVPDGLDKEEDRNDIGRLTESLMKTMPLCLEELIRKSSEAGDRITCMIVDESMAWALEIAKKMGLRSAAFWPASAQLLATLLRIPELTSKGVIDADGKN